MRKKGAQVATLGPGIANTVNAVAQASLDRSALIVITGEVAGNLKPIYTHQIFDQESLLRDLVASGVGASFLREDLARAAVQAGEMAIWPEGSADTMLSMVYLKARERSPEIRALLRSVEDVWKTETRRSEQGAPG